MSITTAALNTPSIAYTERLAQAGIDAEQILRDAINVKSLLQLATLATELDPVDG